MTFLVMRMIEFKIGLLLRSPSFSENWINDILGILY